MRTLHELPPFRDRWSYLYLEHGELDQQASGLVFHNASALTPLPINQLSLLMLGPGTTVTHAAVRALAGNNCLLAWVGEEGVRLYAHGTGGTFSARRLLVQAKLVTAPDLRLAWPSGCTPSGFRAANCRPNRSRNSAGWKGRGCGPPTPNSPPSTGFSGTAGGTTRATGRPRPR